MSNTTSAARSRRARTTMAAAALVASALTAVGCSARPGSVVGSHQGHRRHIDHQARRGRRAGDAELPRVGAADVGSGPGLGSGSPRCAPRWQASTPDWWRGRSG